MMFVWRVDIANCRDKVRQLHIVASDLLAAVKTLDLVKLEANETVVGLHRLHQVLVQEIRSGQEDVQVTWDDEEFEDEDDLDFDEEA